MIGGHPLAAPGQARKRPSEQNVFVLFLSCLASLPGPASAHPMQGMDAAQYRTYGVVQGLDRRTGISARVVAVISFS